MTQIQKNTWKCTAGGRSSWAATKTFRLWKHAVTLGVSVQSLRRIFKLDLQFHTYNFGHVVVPTEWGHSASSPKFSKCAEKRFPWTYSLFEGWCRMASAICKFEYVWLFSVGLFQGKSVKTLPLHPTRANPKGPEYWRSNTILLAICVIPNFSNQL